MPQNVSTILEHKTGSILETIQAFNRFMEAGHGVHLNFYPVVDESNIAFNRLQSESLIWEPAIQENKLSTYSGKSVHHKANLKKNFIKR